jgi:hypothetical protein
MAANTLPIFPLTPKIGISAPILTANTAMDGTGTVTTLFTAGVNGSRVDYIKARCLGTAVQTVVRIFLNNGSSTAVSTNNTLFMERLLNAQTAVANSETSDYIIPLNVSLPTGWTVTATIGTTVGSGWQFTVVAGDY